MRFGSSQSSFFDPEGSSGIICAITLIGSAISVNAIKMLFLITDANLHFFFKI